MVGNASSLTYACVAAVLDPQQRSRLDRSPMTRDMIAGMHTLNVDFYPRESRVATFRDPWSFPVLFHPGCNNLVRAHLEDLSRKVRRLTGCASILYLC
jgi:syntaxin-binding protein 1